MFWCIALLMTAAAALFALWQKPQGNPLHAAVLVGDLPLVQHLLSTGAAVNGRYSDPNHDIWRTEVTPLMLAAAIDNAAMVDLLVDHGADVAATDRHSHTALAHAAHHSSDKTFMRLVNRGSSMKDTIAFGEAAYQGSPTMLKLMLTQTWDQNELGTVLAYASSSVSFEKVQMLLDHGADPNFSGYVCTPLMSAATENNPTIMQLLLDHGAKVDALDSSGRTALSMASEFGNAKAVQLLLMAHANPRLCARGAPPPLAMAAMSGNAETLSALLASDARQDLEWRRSDGPTPLILAAWFGDAARVRLLLDAGADVKAKTDQGKSASDVASGRSDAEGKKILDILRR